MNRYCSYTNCNNESGNSTRNCPFDVDTLSLNYLVLVSCWHTQPRSGTSTIKDGAKPCSDRVQERNRPGNRQPQRLSAEKAAGMQSFDHT